MLFRSIRVVLISESEEIKSDELSTFLEYRGKSEVITPSLDLNFINVIEGPMEILLRILLFLTIEMGIVKSLSILILEFKNLEVSLSLDW